MSEENKTTQVAELIKENRELKAEIAELEQLLKYYYGSEMVMEEANAIQDRCLEAEAELQKNIERIDDYSFNKETELSQRESRVEKEEQRLKKASAKVKEMERNVQSYIEKKSDEEIAKFKNTGIKLIAAITVFYTLIAGVIYLVCKGG